MVPDIAAEVLAEVLAEVAAEVVAEIVAEILTEILAGVAAEVLVVQLDQGVGNLVHHCVIVQAGSGFDVDTGVALCSTVAGR